MKIKVYKTEESGDMKILVIHKVYIDVDDDKFSSLCNLA